MFSTCNVKGVMRNSYNTALIGMCSVIGVIIKYDDTGVQYTVTWVIVKCNVTEVRRWVEGAAVCLVYLS